MGEDGLASLESSTLRASTVFPGMRLSFSDTPARTENRARALIRIDTCGLDDAPAFELGFHRLCKFGERGFGGLGTAGEKPVAHFPVPQDGDRSCVQPGGDVDRKPPWSHQSCPGSGRETRLNALVMIGGADLRKLPRQANIDQTIMGPNGKSAFVVLPYAQFVKKYRQANALVPNEVVNLAFDNGWSPARAWREHLKLTQAAVAKRMKVTQAAVAQFEAPGAKLRKVTRDKLAAALRLTRDQFAW